MIAAILITGCGNPSRKFTGPVKSFHEIKYSQLFGIAHFEAYDQLFYLDGGDTLWSLKSTELPKGMPRVAVTSSVFAGFIEALGLQESIVGVDNDKYFNDPVMLERIGKGQVGIIGEEGQMQTEKLVTLRPDVLIASSHGFNNTTLKNRLKQVNVHVLMCDNFKEQHPLARAEWIKVFGFIYGRPVQADSLFSMVEKNYLQIRDSAKFIRQKPLVMTEAMYSEVWSIPGGSSYTARLIEDAGGTYIFSNRKGLHTYPLNLESVLKESGDADIWIHVNQFKSKDRMLKANPRYALFKPFRDNRVYNNNKRENAYGGNDFWETGAFRADLVLRDLVTIFSGQKISEDKLYFYTLVD